MKKTLFATLIFIAFGCGHSSIKPGMSIERLEIKLDESISAANAHIIARNTDSAFFYQGKAEAFFEAVYNEKPPRPKIDTAYQTNRRKKDIRLGIMYGHSCTEKVGISGIMYGHSGRQ